MLDCGAYPLTVGQNLLGYIVSAGAEIHHGETGVDVLSLLIVRIGSGALGPFACGLVGEMPVASEVLGARGVIRILPPLYCPTRVEIEAVGGDVEQIDSALNGNGYTHEVDEVHRSLSSGLTESQNMSLG